ncbi:uncharacterized protein PAC_11776 [Phialocephala subalpina]|uniref:Xylanolytic transcriptional activator regulatory domain-containing protein n=1 Tax=Phialocephala subalpina TaxID=576137 RepID=A0A1L7XA32_9HELO|nr:uncharacterized protein PAC_11776 [Phialocephala subalpina]
MEKGQRAVGQSKRRQKYTRNAWFVLSLAPSWKPAVDRLTAINVRDESSSVAAGLDAKDVRIAKFGVPMSVGLHRQVQAWESRRGKEEGQYKSLRLTKVRYQNLEAGLRQLQSSLDLALRHIEASSQDPDIDVVVDVEAHDDELDAILIQAASEIETCLSGTGKETRPLKVGSEILPDPFTPPSSFAVDDILTPSHITSIPTIFPFSRMETCELIEYFRFEGERFYPFIQFDSLLVLAGTIIDPSVNTFDPAIGTGTTEWDDKLDDRNLDLLWLVVACALASKVNRETEVSRNLLSIASERLTTKMSGPTFDVKDIAIATLLCDETVLAWRKISTAAKMCQELGLHKSLDGKPSWVSKMFWCIYVLDRRFSFMINFPFTLHDEDMDHRILEYDRSSYYLSSLIEYVRIAARFVPRMPKLGSNYILMEPSTCISLDIETDKWALSTSMNRPLSYNLDHLDLTNSAPGDQFNEAWVAVCKNQLKIGLYKHYLFSSDNVCQNPHLSHKAVSSASDTIRSCSELRRATPMYELQAVNFNFFVLSAVAALYLAVRHAPLQFSNAPRDIFTGLQILKACCTSGTGSEHLCQKVSTLENAMKRLGYDPLGIGPQLILHEISSNIKTPDSTSSGWKEETEIQNELTPRSESFSSFLSQMMAAESIEWTADHPFPQPQGINAWDNRQWTHSPPI